MWDWGSLEISWQDIRTLRKDPGLGICAVIPCQTSTWRRFSPLLDVGRCKRLSEIEADGGHS
jgi:hypothetical protein